MTDIDTDGALQLAEEGFRAAFEQAPIGMALVGLDGRLLQVNEALAELFGYACGDLLGARLADLTHPDDVAGDRDDLERLLAGEIRAFQIDQRCYHRRGRTLWVTRSVSLVRDADGEPRHYVAQIADVTATKTAEAALQDAHAQLRAVFDHVPAYLTLRGLDGRYLNVNDEAIRGFGTTREGLIGNHPGSHIDPAHAARIHDDDRRIWESRAPFASEESWVASDGELHSFHVIRYPVLDECGEVSAFGSFALDITERQRSDAARERALAEFAEAQRIAHVGSWTWDPGARTAVWSPELYRIYGYDPAEPISAETLVESSAPDDRVRVLEAFRRGCESGLPFELDYRIITRQGVERTLHVLGRPDRDRTDVFTGTCQDVTEMRAAERELRVAEERFRSAFEHAPVGMVLADLDGRFVKVNDALCAMLGYRPEELLATSDRSITHPEDLEVGREQLEALLSGELDHFHREKRYLRASGEPLWVAVHLSLLRDRDGRPLQFVGQLLDITERRRLEKELRHLADHDPLTGLLNRRGLEAELERQVGHVSRYGDRGALLVLDLDHFKVVNDTLGHDAGDQLIVSIAEILTERLRATDLVARLGGDEFAVLLPEADAENAREVAGQLVADIHEHAMVAGGQMPRHISASVGVTTFHRGLTSGEEALINADVAMYEAKESGRNRFAVHFPDRGDHPRLQARRAWVERIRDALEHDLLTLFAQPIVELATGEVVQHELLLRMMQLDGDSIPPGAFLYIAERYDLVQELDGWVARRAIGLLDAGRPGELHGDIAVNVSGKSLADDALLEIVEAELERTGADAGRLVFEVTETAAIANLRLARRFAERLEGLGCRFALDDFGAGFGSFAYLKHIPFDFLKLDAELISGCRTNRTDQLVIESLVSIARGLGKRTIAEGVEHDPTRRFLTGAGVDLAQGYLFGHPAPITWPAPRPDGDRPSVGLP